MEINCLLKNLMTRAFESESILNLGSLLSSRLLMKRQRNLHKGLDLLYKKLEMQFSKLAICAIQNQNTSLKNLSSTFMAGVLLACLPSFIKFTSEHGLSNFKYPLYRLTMERPLNIHILKVYMTVWKLICGCYTVSNNCMKQNRKK